MNSRSGSTITIRVVMSSYDGFNNKEACKKESVVVLTRFDNLNHNKEWSDFAMELKDQKTENFVMEPMGEYMNGWGWWSNLRSSDTGSHNHDIKNKNNIQILSWCAQGSIGKQCSRLFVSSRRMKKQPRPHGRMVVAG